MKGLLRNAGLLAVLCVGASGCRHKPPPPLAVPPPSTVPLQPTPEPPLVAKVPVEPGPLPAVKVPAKKIPKPRKKVAPPPVAPAPPAAEVASATPEPKLAIGSLSAGGDAAPANRQRAAETLAELDKRIAALPANTVHARSEGIARVRNFEREARKALDSGDGDGALTLATKAKLLLDDLLR